MNAQLKDVQVVVASKNQVKVNAARVSLDKGLNGIARLHWHHEEAPSGVRDQPVGDEETLAGARNRASAILARYPKCLAVAIEGGVGPATFVNLQTNTSSEEFPLECFAWVVIQNGATGAESIARSGSFVLPPPVSKLVHQGIELGHADDQVFKRVKSGQGSGTVGFLSHGHLARQVYYEQAVMLALLPFMNPQYYGKQYQFDECMDRLMENDQTH